MLSIASRAVPDLSSAFTVEDWVRIGDLFFIERNYQKAGMAYSEAITIPPTDKYGVLTKYALCKMKTGDLRSCEWAINEAFQLEPESPFAYHAQAMLLHTKGEFEVSACLFRKAVEIMPDNPDFRLNFAYLLQTIGKFPEAEAQYGAVIERNPAHMEARFYRALALLTQGRFEEGFQEYEMRYALNISPVPQNGKTVWRGQESIAGKKILLCCEQGLGDAVQFARYATWLKRVHGVSQVILAAKPDWHKLLSCIEDIDAVVADDLNGDYDFHCPIMSMPGLSLDDFGLKSSPWPGTGKPYLHIGAPRVTITTDVPKVGLVWKGNPAHGNDHYRSMEAEEFEPLLDLPCLFFNLQHDARYPGNTGKVVDLKLDSVFSLAERIAEMDVVVTVDTATLHIAGAIGIHALGLLACGPDFRWGLGKSTTPWYPSIKLFRQSHPLEWKSVIAEVREHLLAISKRFP